MGDWDWFSISMFILIFLIILFGWAVKNGDEYQKQQKKHSK